MATDSRILPDGNSGQGSVRRDYLGLAACFSSAALLIALSWFRLGSVDVGYHVAYGEHFLESREIVERDPFLIPENSVEFVNANWGAQIVLALAWRMGGASGLIALRLVLLGIVFGAVGVVIWRTTRGLHWVAWGWLLLGLAGYERFSMRPELFSYAILAIQLVVLSREVLSVRHVLVLMLLQVGWVNLHSYFLVGLLVTGCRLAGACLTWFRAPRASDSASAARRAARLFAVALVLQMAACVVNPWHVRGAVFPLKTLGYLEATSAMGSGAGETSESPWGAISEFHSPFNHWGILAARRTIHSYVLLLVVAAVAVALNLFRGRTADVLMLVVFVAMSLQMRRNIAQLAIVAAPLAMGAFAGFFRSREGAGRVFERYVRPVLLVLSAALSIWWVAGIVDGRFYFVERRQTREFGTGYNGRVLLPDAVRWLADQEERPEDQRPAGRIFINYNASSNALLWLPRRYRQFVDTNTFACSEDVLGLAQRLGNGLVRASEISEGYDDQLRKYGIDVLLLQTGADADGLIRQVVDDRTEWALVYVDRHAVIFLRRIPQHIPIISANRLTSASLDADAWMDAIRGPAACRALELGTSAVTPLLLGRYDKAMVLLKEAVRLRPDYHEAWTNLGQCHGIRANLAEAEGRSADEAAADLREAIDCFDRALRLAPQDPAALANRDKALEALKSLFPASGQEI